MRFGFEAKLYFCVAGIGGTPTWTEITNVKNLTLDLKKAEVDATTRANNGWKAIAARLKEGAIDFEMVWDTADPGFTAIRQAFFGDTLLGMAVMDGPVATVGSQGLWADMEVVGFTREEPVEEAIVVKVSVKPGYSANAPQWKNVAA